jgi:hypothetical protein
LPDDLMTPSAQIWKPVKIYREDGEGLDWNKVDDLIVRIYHMV